ncbi:hypothetical protein COT72_05605 [archaeon CG10_big_fil_rev_8_21_14_0_10_43_11]|nr:MAG: hypothetical protein COT72_05605 [archaeon CG10_big_fil_rev_8_21_14_0_10_43_11]
MLVESFSVLIALYVAWGIGANDVNLAGPVASKSLKVTHAVFFGAIAAMLGAALFGGNVSHTLREEIATNSFGIAHVFAILLGVAVWSMIASFKGWPISSTVSVVGAIAGVALLTGNMLNLKTLVGIGASWIISPLSGFVFAFVSYRVFAKLTFSSIKSFGVRERIERVLSYAQVALVLGVIFVRSANDVAQAIFFFEAQNPLLFRIIGGAGLAFGIVTIGKRVIRTLGTKLTELNPSSGVAVQLSSLVVLTLFTSLGMPISGTIVFVSALAGAGVARHRSVNTHFVKEIIFSWIVTLPVSAVIAVSIFTGLRVLGVG